MDLAPTGDAPAAQEGCSPGGIFEGDRNSAGEREGRGTYRFVDGGVYEGEWLANLQEGRGVEWWVPGDGYPS